MALSSLSKEANGTRELSESSEVDGKAPVVDALCRCSQRESRQGRGGKTSPYFSPSYRRFLLEYGAGSFGASEFYGVIDEKFENSSLPNGIWCTLQERRLGNLPLSLVNVSSDGAGGYFCIDCTAELAEAPIVTYHMGYPPHRQGKETVATSFGKFCLDLVRRELEP